MIKEDVNINVHMNVICIYIYMWISDDIGIMMYGVDMQYYGNQYYANMDVNMELILCELVLVLV